MGEPGTGSGPDREATRDAGRGPAVIVVTADDDRYADVRRTAMEVAAKEHARLILYDWDAATVLGDPLPSAWSAEGTRATPSRASSTRPISRRPVESRSIRQLRRGRGDRASRRRPGCRQGLARRRSRPTPANTTRRRSSSPGSCTQWRARAARDRAHPIRSTPAARRQATPSTAHRRPGAAPTVGFQGGRSSDDPLSPEPDPAGDHVVGAEPAARDQPAQELEAFDVAERPASRDRVDPLEPGRQVAASAVDSPQRRSPR